MIEKKEHINVRELRPGNYVLRWGSPVQICGTQVLSHVAVVFVYDGHSVLQFGCQEIFPIPLTPEWLERCGFAIETIPDSVDDEGDIIPGYTHWTNGKCCFHFGNGKLDPLVHINSVHMFQNWYFFNKGEELEIKLS